MRSDDRTSSTIRRNPRLRRLGGALVPVLLAFSLGGTVAACGSSGNGWSAPPDAGATAAADPHAAMGHLGTVPTGEVVAATWAARPAYVSGNGARTDAAYRYALEHGNVIQWLPCYCGCVEMDHRSNLDCFLRPHESGGTIAFEEHGSFCDVCVDIALMAREMVLDGKSAIEIRAAVDAEFGDIAPGTKTALPPAG